MSQSLHFNSKLHNPRLAESFTHIDSAITHPIAALTKAFNDQSLDHGKINLNGGLGFHTGEDNTARN